MKEIISKRVTKTSIPATILPTKPKNTAIALEKQRINTTKSRYIPILAFPPSFFPFNKPKKYPNPTTNVAKLNAMDKSPFVNILSIIIIPVKSINFGNSIPTTNVTIVA